MSLCHPTQGGTPAPPGTRHEEPESVIAKSVSGSTRPLPQSPGSQSSKAGITDPPAVKRTTDPSGTRERDVEWGSPRLLPWQAPDLRLL